jgi:hypothetical protein
MGRRIIFNDGNHRTLTHGPRTHNSPYQKQWRIRPNLGQR